jgi:hypothetical protein
MNERIKVRKKIILGGDISRTDDYQEPGGTYDWNGIKGNEDQC